MGSTHPEVHAEIGVRGTFVVGFETVDEGRDRHGQRWWVCVPRDLSDELRRHFATSFFSEDLFPSNPAILVNQVDPVL